MAKVLHGIRKLVAAGVRVTLVSESRPCLPPRPARSDPSERSAALGEEAALPLAKGPAAPSFNIP